ncbi:hypothetical protein BGHDH14_bgh03311 [Blumeria hordei DH14]|uniref:Uncharacterized protein n=1 Tax=Blumeria graminis f. sp. hordei (strain DH14) TaxID=546991 RepID=N1J8V0_BLUG1|nr:hypothetical protein BGHDH14_bgh03311 [Blumeria hordei DH14]
MGKVVAPFLYDAPKSEGSCSPYHSFDPRAISRTSFQSTAPRPKVVGPLVSMEPNYNHYNHLSRTSTKVKPMHSSVKKHVSYTQKTLLALRYCQLFCSCALFVIGLLANPIHKTAVWVIRIAIGVTIGHTIYALYHLSRKASGRIPASSASYSLFASLLDIASVAFFIYIAFFYGIPPTHAKYSLLVILNVDIHVFYKMGLCSAAVGTCLYSVSSSLSLYLAVVFRKIAAMPPDMNPLEDNLTSRHKRNKSSIATNTFVTEVRSSVLTGSKRSSGASYTKSNYLMGSKILQGEPRVSYAPSDSTQLRNARQALPSQAGTGSPAPTELKRSSGSATSPKKPSYIEVPLSDDNESFYQSLVSEFQPTTWYAGDSIKKSCARSSCVIPDSPQTRYTPLQTPQSNKNHPNPLQANPPSDANESSPQSQSPRETTDPLLLLPNKESYRHSEDSSDIGDAFINRSSRDQATEHLTRAPRYGDLRPGKPPVMVGRSDTRQISSGNDYFFENWSPRSILGRRDVSGKLIEEGRSNESGLLNMKLRKFSGKLLF